jgi:2-haloacid dehalogenase
MPYTALLFDLDDTVLDFVASEDAALNHTFDAFFSERYKREEFKEKFKAINHFLWEEVAHGRTTPWQLKIDRFRELTAHEELDLVAHFYENKLGEQVVWFPGAKEALERLRKEYAIGFVTNGMRRVQEKKYQLSGIKKWCDCFIISEVVGLAKPDQRIFQLALDKLQKKPSEVLMVGDSIPFDYQGALNAKLDFCWINSRGGALPPELPLPKYELPSVSALPQIMASLEL